MTLEKASQDVLRHLFADYLKGPAVQYQINKYMKSKTDAVALSDFMLNHHWIRDRWVYPDNTVTCRITIRGIEEVNPAYIRHKLKEVIGGLGEAGGSKHLIELLELKVTEYSLTMDLIKQLEDLRLINLLHPKDQIVVELTPDGWKHFEQGSKRFFTLMTY